MKIIISYPPLDATKGCPTLGQNRQFQYFKDPTFIYPVVPAQAATLLKNSGFKVIWNDCIALGWTHEQFLDFVKKEKPDLIVFETKTPVIKQHWQIINAIKKLMPLDSRPLTLLFGDHVTALPEESFQNSEVDYVLTGGDYDFLLLSLCRFLSSRRNSGNTQYAIRNTNNVSPAASLEPGIYYRDNGSVKNTGKFQLNHDLNQLPFIDRDLTGWQMYAYQNGNYKRTPGTYIMSGRDCWWARCSFCSWPTLYPSFRIRKEDNVLDEIGLLLERYGVREIMDDTGCFPAGGWLGNFCHGLLKRGYQKKIYIDCNARFGALSKEDFRLMKKAGFRLLLFGLESANQKTLDRINKNVKVERIIADCQNASRAGLFPHITIMFGYPWESYEDASRTLQLGSWLLEKGYAYTMQATIVIPYPGTPLFQECKEEGRLKTVDWDRYDMKEAVMRIPFSEDAMRRLVQGMYKVSFGPEFIARRLLSIRDMDDVAYFLRAAKKVLGHIFDFKNDTSCNKKR
ncbi:MAG: radical SAM protein [Candidatus Omnitrophica bacterium]|nr:radical SAM protein [Candidatus Omnitrophota bacterium]